MDCIDNYIGLLGCEGIDTPDSGLFINSLPGVNLEITDKIADHEQRTFLGVWTDVVTRVKAKFKTEIQYALRGKLKVNDCDDDCSLTDLICENIDHFKLAVWYLHGVELMAERIHTSRMNKFTTIDTKRAKELRAEFEVEYQRAMEMAALSFDCDTDCLVCDPLVQYDDNIM